MAAGSPGGSPEERSPNEHSSEEHSDEGLGARRQEALHQSPGGSVRPAWTFLTNHGHVLLSVARDPEIRVADIAGRVGITTRAALQILKDLEGGGYLQRTRVGRRTRYTIRPHQHFRHPTTAAQEVDGLLRLFSGPAPQVGPAQDGPAAEGGPVPKNRPAPQLQHNPEDGPASED